MAAKDGMERYKSPEMQLRVRSVTHSIYTVVVYRSTSSNLHRLVGVSALDPVIAVTTKPASASSLLSD